MRLWTDFDRHALRGHYREGVHKILAAYMSAWELDEEGGLRRVLPTDAVHQVAAALGELQAERFTPALELFTAARDAYDDRPRCDRDACSNMFDTLVSVAKERYQMPSATFGQVVARIPAGTMNRQIVGVLSAFQRPTEQEFRARHDHAVPAFAF